MVTGNNEREERECLFDGLLYLGRMSAMATKGALLYPPPLLVSAPALYLLNKTGSVAGYIAVVMVSVVVPFLQSDSI